MVTSQVEDKDERINEISSSVNLKLAMNFMHSSKPAKIVYSPPNGFFRKNKSNLKHYIKKKTRKIRFHKKLMAVKASIYE